MNEEDFEDLKQAALKAKNGYELAEVFMHAYVACLYSAVNEGSNTQKLTGIVQTASSMAAESADMLITSGGGAGMELEMSVGLPEGYDEMGRRH